MVIRAFRLAALTLFAAAASPGISAQEAPQLTDPQIAHVAVTANAIDVEMGELALSRAASDEVGRFARTMITVHTAVNEQAAALADRLGVTPEDNTVSASLRNGAASARSELRQLRGAAFDRAYVEREIAYHQSVLDALDGLLIPQTDNAELKALLEQVRPAIAAHLDHAKTITADLPAGRS